MKLPQRRYTPTIVLKIFECHPDDIHAQGLRKFPSMLRVEEKSMLLHCACKFFRAEQYSLSTGVSTIIREALLSAVCEISTATSQSSAFTLAFCKYAFAI